MEIYIAKNKAQMGPYDIGQVTQMLQTGILEKYDLYWHEGMLDWAPVACLKTEVGRPSQAPESPLPSHPSNQSPRDYPPDVYGGSEPLATWSLVLGLMALLCFGMLAGIPAVVCGHLALSKINRDPALKGSGAATAGLICGYLGSILWFVMGLSMFFANGKR